MSTSKTQIPHLHLSNLPVRSRRVVGEHGEELVGTTVYCRLHEKSVAVSECEACEHFHALHFDAETRATSVVCHCEPPSSVPSEEAARAAVLGGPIDPHTALADIMTRDFFASSP